MPQETYSKILEDKKQPNIIIKKKQNTPPLMTLKIKTY